MKSAGPASCNRLFCRAERSRQSWQRSSGQAKVVHDDLHTGVPCRWHRWARWSAIPFRPREVDHWRRRALPKVGVKRGGRSLGTVGSSPESLPVNSQRRIREADLPERPPQAFPWTVAPAVARTQPITRAQASGAQGTKHGGRADRWRSARPGPRAGCAARPSRRWRAAQESGTSTSARGTRRLLPPQLTATASPRLSLCAQVTFQGGERRYPVGSPMGF